MKKTTTSNYIKMSLKQVYAMYERDIKIAKNRIYGDIAILKMIELISDKTSVIECELARGGDVLNRGSAGECIARILLNDLHTTKKRACNWNDIIYQGVAYEVKYTNSFAYASLSDSQLKDYLSGNYKPLIIILPSGIYISNTQYYVFCKNGKIKDASHKRALIEWDY